jgi:hypothetical protein
MNQGESTERDQSWRGFGAFESDSSDDEYSIIARDETSSDAGVGDTDSDENESTESEDAVGETLSEADQEGLAVERETQPSDTNPNDKALVVEDTKQVCTPTINITRVQMVPMSDFLALQAQVSVLTETLVRDRSVYKQKLSDLEGSQNILAEQSQVIKQDNRRLAAKWEVAEKQCDGVTSPSLASRSDVEVLKFQLAATSRAVNELKEGSLLTSAQLEELKKSHGLLSMMVHSNLGKFQQTLECISVEQQKLKNLYVANTKTLEALEIRVHQVTDSTASMETERHKQLQSYCEELLRVGAVVDKLTVHVGEVELVSHETDEQIASIHGRLDQWAEERVPERLAELEETMKNQTNTLSDAIEKRLNELEKSLNRKFHAICQFENDLDPVFSSHLRAIRQELYSRIADETQNYKQQTERLERQVCQNVDTTTTMMTRKLSDLESRMNYKREFEEKILEDFLIARMREGDMALEDRLAKAERDVEELGHRMPYAEGNFIPERKQEQVDLRLTACETGVSQLQKIQLDTIRACKPTAHDCARVVHQVNDLRAWRNSVEQCGMDKCRRHADLAEKRMTQMVDDVESNMELWRMSTSKLFDEIDAKQKSCSERIASCFKGQQQIREEFELKVAEMKGFVKDEATARQAMNATISESFDVAIKNIQSLDSSMDTVAKHIWGKKYKP